MRSIAFDRRLLTTILVCLAISASCAGRESKSGHVYFSRDLMIWRLDLSNGQETLLIDRHPTEGVSVSPDGKTLSYVVPEELRRGSARSVWTVDTHTGQETEVSQSMPFLDQFWLSDSRLLVIEYPDWHISVAGTLVKEGDVQTLIIDPSTGQSILAPWSVAPSDSGSVVYAPTFDCAARVDTDDQAQDMLQVVCLDSSDPIAVGAWLSIGDVTWSLDGELLAFHAGEETTTWDSWRLYVWERESRNLRGIDIGDRTALGLGFSPDNRWLAFEDDSNLCTLDLDNEDGVTCFENYLSVVGIPVSWSLDNQSVVLATCADGVCSSMDCDCSDSALVAVAIPSGKITELTTGVDIVPSPVWGR